MGKDVISEGVIESGWSHMIDLLLFIKSTNVTGLSVIDLIFIRLPAKRLLLGPGLILTSPARINNSDTHGLTCLNECDTLRICPCIAKKP